MTHTLRLLSRLTMPATMLAGGMLLAQEPTAPAPQTPTPAATTQPDAAQTPAADQKDAGAAPAAAAGGNHGNYYVKVGKKEEYQGPKDIIVLAPTPMLNEEGKQRVDPDGKPMFNPPVKQMRDKHGNPEFDDKGKPVFQTAKDLGYDDKGKKIPLVKEKPPKTTPVSIVEGTYTVDGVIGKAKLNYDIADLKYIYLYAPGIGITVVSNDPFPGAKEQKDAFNGKTLTVTVGEHTLQVASDVPLMKEKKPVSAFVLVDRDFALPSRYPVMGYGELRKAPYQWPGSKQGKEVAGVVAPPPVPVNLRPVTLLAPCPTGQMRMPAPPVLPGQVAPQQPCAPIAQALAAQKAMDAKAKASVQAKPAESVAPAVATAPAVAPTPAGDPK